MKNLINLFFSGFMALPEGAPTSQVTAIKTIGMSFNGIAAAVAESQLPEEVKISLLNHLSVAKRSVEYGVGTYWKGTY